MEKKELKELLVRILDHNNVIPEQIKPYDLAIEMLQYIGDIDLEMRDDLVLTILCNWIMDKTLTDEEVKNLLLIILDTQHLLKGLGETNDTVFGRTFSVLLVATIIYRHRNDKFLSGDELLKAFQAVIQFYTEDQDVRGYVEEKGWAHGAAHGADALDEFARCEEIKGEGLLIIIDAIFKKVNISHYGYTHFEEERMITAVKAVLGRNILTSTEVEAWIRSFCDFKKTDVYHEDMVREVNINAFLKSLYFRLVDIPEYQSYAIIVKESLHQISRFKNIE
ncbi:MAG: hypothetical protein K0R34_3956 [Herbinix sp.]|nr:hypothetical protein [Herbinix sp.]